ncbi:HNH endonuclease [Enterocloster lavalensis]|uniref:HNH endonuclease n=1 Tax=Enterocloster lavalensis TaxID=460384 RepID=UPI002A83FE76|nr:HNH endonuclease [Enterocloster lavalensis]
MDFNPGINIGDHLTNNELCQLFKCGNMGGMRRSKKTGTLVIISDHTKNFYHDEWKDGILHYTGMGKNGDQVLEGNQNGTLYHSDTNGVNVHLFEVLEKSVYTYKGIVKLAAQPYQAAQETFDGEMRSVWIFPVKPVLDIEEWAIEVMEKEAVTLSNTELYKRVKTVKCESRKPRTVETKVYDRNPYLKELVKRIAEGKCQYCGETAPFIDKNGEPYLEEHHVTWLARGGSDTIDNVVVVCPNCHTKAHVLDDDITKITLEEVAKQNVKRLKRLLAYEREIKTP